jgi:asparagine synthase (glutamine-hydrolysing)
MVPPSLRGRIAGLAYMGKTSARRQKAREFALARPTLLGLSLRRRRLFSDLELGLLGFEARDLALTEDFLPVESEPGRELDGLDAVSAMSVIESRFYMGNMLLRDADVFGMAHGLEIRVPMLDRELVDYVLGLMGSLRVRRGSTNKPLLFDALGKAVFRDIPRRRKRGFSLPHAKWMTGPLRGQFEDLLDNTKQSGIVESDGVQAVWDAFLDDPDGPTWSRAWMLGVLGGWLDRRRTVDGGDVPHDRTRAA